MKLLLVLLLAALLGMATRHSKATADSAHSKTSPQAVTAVSHSSSPISSPPTVAPAAANTTPAPAIR